jgi:hypothetical protein
VNGDLLTASLENQRVMTESLRVIDSRLWWTQAMLVVGIMLGFMILLAVLLTAQSTRQKLRATQDLLTLTSEYARIGRAALAETKNVVKKVEEMTSDAIQGSGPQKVYVQTPKVEVNMEQSSASRSPSPGID